MKTKNILLYLLATAIVGCVPSLHSLFTDKNLVFADALLGVWISDSGNDTWELKRYSDNKDKRYRLIHTDREKGKHGRFLVTFGKLNDMLFADFYPEDIESDASYFYQCHQLLGHTFGKIEPNELELKITMMDHDNVKKLLQTEPNLIRHEVLEGMDGKIVLTASTDELQKFVVKYVSDPNIFGCGAILKRKIQEPKDPNCTSQKKN
jgi:hypothetical protein